MTIGRGHDLPHAGPSHLGFAPRLPERVERAAERAERAERERHDRFDNPDRAHPTHSASAPGSASASSPASSASAAMHRRPTNPSYGAPLSALLPLLQRGGRNGHAGHSHTTFASHAHTHNGHREMNPYARPITHPRHPSATASATPASPAGPSISAGGTPTASGSASGSRPVQRSRNGCYTCRKRKVKCDERTPICIKCEYSGRGCEWPPEDPVIRRKNRPRKMKLHLVSDSKPASSPPAAPPAPPPPLTEDAKRTLRVPIHALQAFAATLPKLPRDRGYDTGPAGIAGTMTGMQGLKGLKGMGERMMPRRLRAGLMTDAAFLAPYFPQVDERLIFRHFVHHTAPLGLARDDPDPKRTWNPWVSLLAPLAFVHLPGESPAGDALRAALLAIGSVHLHYLSDPLDSLGAGKIIALARPTILGLVRSSLNTSSTPPSGVELDLILGSLLGLCVASALSADSAWSPLLRDVVGLLTDLGGAAHLLSTAPKDQLSIRRFVLEQLAVRDVLGCMAEIAGSGEPMLLKAGRDRAFAGVFFDAAAWSATDEEWESVERGFGVSRTLVDLIAKTSTLVAHVRGGQAESPTAERPGSRDSAAGAGAGSGSGVGEKPDGAKDGAQSGGGGEESLEAEADSLMAELKVWDESAKFSPWHQRTAYGNAAHRHALTIRLIRDVFNCPASDRRVQAAAKAVLELAVEAVSTFGSVVWLAWPVVLAGCQLARTDPAREVVMNLLGNTSRRACFDLDAARELVVAHWRRCDAEALAAVAAAAGAGASGTAGENGKKAAQA